MCIRDRFNELPLLCEDRYREIIDQAEAPLAYTPLVMDHRLLNLVTDMAAYLDEPVPPCNKFINLKCQELVYLITNYYPLPQLKSFFHPISSYTESFHYFVMQNYTKVDVYKRQVYQHACPDCASVQATAFLPRS